MKQSYSAAGSTRIAGHAVDFERHARAPAARCRKTQAARYRVPVPTGRRSPCLQRPAFMPTDRATQLGAARAERRRRIDAASDTHVGARAAPASGRGMAEPQHAGRPRTGALDQGSSGTPSSVAAQSAPVTANAPSASNRTSKGKSCASIAAAFRSLPSKKIAAGQRQRIHGAGDPDAPTQGAKAAQILHRGQRRAREDLDHRITFVGLEDDAVARLEQHRRVARDVEEAHRRCVPIVFQPLGPSEAETPVCAPPIETAPPGILITGTLRRGVAMRGSMPPR